MRAGLGLDVRRPVHGDRPRAPAAREDRARPGAPRRLVTVWGVGYRWDATGRDRRQTRRSSCRGRLLAGAVVAALGGVAARRSVRRRRSVTGPLAVVARGDRCWPSSPAWSATARAMFLSEHDLGVVLGRASPASCARRARARRRSSATCRALGRLARSATAASRDRRDRAGELPSCAELARRAELAERASASSARGAAASWSPGCRHDLRTPLAGLRAMAEALEDGVADDPGAVPPADPAWRSTGWPAWSTTCSSCPGSRPARCG